jgi:Short C-terminal domain/Family of unknown function (DUF6325)
MELGPVEYLIISFPGNRFNGEITPAIADLVERGTIRILDLAFIIKDADGQTATFEYDELDEAAGFVDIDGEADGLFSDEDLQLAADALDPDSSALFIVWEDLWASELAKALRDRRRRTGAALDRPSSARRSSDSEQGDDVMMRRGLGRRGRPGLVGTMARTAVVAGTATAVVGGMNRRQQGKAEQAAEAEQYEMAQQQAAIDASVAQQLAAQQPAPAAAPAQASVIDQLKELAELKEQGILTEAEFTAQKTKLLGS